MKDFNTISTFEKIKLKKKWPGIAQVLKITTTRSQDKFLTNCEFLLLLFFAKAGFKYDIKLICA